MSHARSGIAHAVPPRSAERQRVHGNLAGGPSARGAKRRRTDDSAVAVCGSSAGRRPEMRDPPTAPRLRPTGAGLLPEVDAARVVAALRGMWGARNGVSHNPAPNPVSLERRDLPKLARWPYVVAEKTDGVRYCLVLCRSGDGRRRLAAMVDRALRCYDVGEGDRSSENSAWRSCACVSDGSLYDGTLLDGELVAQDHQDENEEKEEAGHAGTQRPVGDGAYDPLRPLAKSAPPGSTTPAAAASPPYRSRLLFALFDSPMVRGRTLNGRTYGERMAIVRSLVEPGDGAVLAMYMAGPAGASLMERARRGGSVVPIEIRAKDFFPARDVDAAWARAAAAPYATDGLLFTRTDDTRVHNGSSWDQFKWKQNHTVDLELRAERVPRASDGSKEDYTVGWRFGLYYVSADFTVSQARKRQCRRPTATAVAAAAAAAPDPTDPVPEVATVRNACDGLFHEGRHVVFEVCANPILERLLAAAHGRGARSLRCIGEFDLRLDEPRQPDTGGDAVRMVRCALRRVRADKREPNNRWTIGRTLVNVTEAISLDELRAAVLYPPGDA